MREQRLSKSLIVTRRLTFRGKRSQSSGRHLVFTDPREQGGLVVAVLYKPSTSVFVLESSDGDTFIRWCFVFQ